MATVPEALAMAIQHHQAGRLQAAEQIYRQILQVEPNHPDALHLLGVIAAQCGKYDSAVEYMGRATQLNQDNANAHNNLGNALREQGKSEEAAACYRRALQLKPDYADAHNNLGAVLRDQGNLEEAVACCRRALELKPNYAEVHNNLGAALQNQGKSDEAIACYRRALELKPDYAKAHYNLGSALKDLGKPDEAAACYRRALELKPDDAEAHNNVGNALLDQGKPDEAAACYRRALELRPDYGEAHNNLGNALMGQGEPDQAAACYRLALQLMPDDADAFSNLGAALRDQGKLEEAVACCRRALELKPDFAEVHNNLGAALQNQGKLEEAVACCRRALELKPDFVEAHNNLGTAYHEQGRLEEAVGCHQRALELKPDFAEAHWHHSLLSLLTGDFERGWAEFEWRWKTKKHHQRSISQPLWDGRPLAGKTILLHADQGFGDTLQFIRFAALVKKRVGVVLCECQPALMSLLEGVAGIDHVIASGMPLPPFDVHAPLMSLPSIFETTLASIPANVPYLRVEPGLVEHWRKELTTPTDLLVGIAWQGNPEHKRDRIRSVPLTRFETLASLAGVRLVSLQKGPGAEQLPALENRFAILDLSDRLNTFLDTAAVIMNLDLVVSVDTAVAHLAGAVGVPVWLALPFVPDWRWLLEREDSPWYPHHRLYRQVRPGDWNEVFERITAALRDLVAKRIRR
jgi:tetratricopeptide (TPR) repeat protein